MKDDLKIFLGTAVIITICCVGIMFQQIEAEDRLTNEIQNYQTTIDSLLDKNQRLNEGFLELYDDRSMMSIEMDKLIRDNKYLKRITR